MKTLAYLPWILCALILSVLSCPTFAISVYTIDHSATDGGPCTLIAFDVDGDDLNYRDSVLLPEWGWGGIDIAIDNLTNTLFVSSESTGIIEIVDAQDLSNHSYTTVEGTSDITAIVYDKENRRLLATDRNQNFLHLIKWDATNAVSSNRVS